MGDFPNALGLDLLSGGVLSTGQSVLGLQTAVGGTTTAWPSANLAIFVPIRVPYQVTVYKMGVGAGGTAAGNFDVGIYDVGGNRLVSSGTTAKGSSTEHILNVTDTVIGPGLYYLALAADGTNNYIMYGGALQRTRLTGIMQAASSFVLPATVTYAAATNVAFPSIAAFLNPA